MSDFCQGRRGIDFPPGQYTILFSRFQLKITHLFACNGACEIDYFSSSNVQLHLKWQCNIIIKKEVFVKKKFGKKNLKANVEKIILKKKCWKKIFRNKNIDDKNLINQCDIIFALPRQEQKESQGVLTFTGSK